MASESTDIKVLDARQLGEFVESMLADQTVIGVKRKDDSDKRFVFDILDSASQLRLDYDVTLLPPKKYFLPPREKLVEFSLEENPSAKACVETPEAAVLIGVHPYDMIAINQLDRLMSETNGDPNYIARRKAMTIIGVDPTRLADRAFWGTMDCHIAREGFELKLSDVCGVYSVKVRVPCSVKV
ncbi:MAG: hypothetical protein J7M14_00245, partial [Planctomycetes bacterium]|nr:hypothetical protein [Planctomycetota bacterium]